MLIDGAVGMVSFCLIFGLLVTVVSILIPVYGYMRKQWKGLALGCLIQPVVCFVVCCLVFGGIVAYEVLSLRSQTKSAMVSVETIEQGVNSHNSDCLE